MSIEEMEKIVFKVASKYYKWFVRLDFDDIVQELWLTLMEKHPDASPLAMRICINKTIDLYRRDKRASDTQTSVDFLEETKSSQDTCSQEVEVLELISLLPRRERLYAISKGYLCGKMDFLKPYFTDMCIQLGVSVSDTARYWTDDYILKTFLGIKSGSKSASLKNIKNNIAKTFGFAV